MRRLRPSSRWLFTVWLGLAWAGLPALLAPVPSWAQSGEDDEVDKTKKKKKKTRKKRRRGKRRRKGKAAKPAPEAPPPDTPPPAPDLEALKRELEAAKREAEGRKESKVTVGTASRWSNLGAMTAVESEVPLTAPLPKRAVPVPVGVSTPGQDLIGEEEILSARLAFSVYHLETRGQDFVFDEEERLVDVDRDIQLIRARATLAYERIAGTDFGVHLDLEYRPRINGTRFTDSRLNELYASYGLTDFRRPGGPNWGIAAGRLAIREAGYAQADGLAFRIRLIPELHLGAFAGVTGNPYGYNWRQRSTEIFSGDWWTGGAFAALRMKRLTVNLAGVFVFANILSERIDEPGVNDGPGIDRVYAHLDAAYLVTPDLNLLLSGWIDMIPSGQTLQNVELVAAYTPLKGLDVNLGVGRFSTVRYELSTGYSYTFDPAGNTFEPNGPPIVDADGNPIVPFDGALFTTVYNQIRLRAGYRVHPDVELYTTVNTLLRDLSATQQIAEDQFGGQVDFASVRVVPGVGARYRNPRIVDASFSASYIADAESNADAVIRGSLGRGLYGLYLQADARAYFGAIRGLDTGLDLTYTLPRDWLPGLLMVRAAFRYYEEAVSIVRPSEDPDAVEVLSPGDPQFVIPSQESYLGFMGIEWRL